MVVVVVVVMETAAAVVVEVMMQKLRHRVVSEIGGVANLLFGHRTQRFQRPHHKVHERRNTQAHSSIPHPTEDMSVAMQANYNCASTGDYVRF